MHEWVGRWPDSLVSSDAGLDREFEERIRDSSGLAFSIAYSVLRNRADAEEVAQDAFARAFRRFRQLRDRDRFRAVAHEDDLAPGCRSLARRPTPGGARGCDRRGAASAHTEDVAISRERSTHVWLAIDQLPEKLRLVVVLSAIEGHDTREVADAARHP